MSFLPILVYFLCAFTSIMCAWLLIRSYRLSRSRLLYWAGTSFFFMALNNIALFFDLAIVPQMNLALVRMVLGVLATGVLLFGMIWETA